MEKTYTYYQPEYVSKFKCDGKACGAYCCRKNWQIDIDKKTYEKYSNLKPKSLADEITSHFARPKGGGTDYVLIPDKNGACHFLGEDNLCSLQKKYGEDFLSETCATFPRFTWNLGKFYERTLSLTCPPVAVQVLLPTEPMKFERVEVTEKVHSNFDKITIRNRMLPPEDAEIFLSIQKTAISILQERSLTIDQRLLNLGLYIYELNVLLKNREIQNLPQLNGLYKNSVLLQEQIEKSLSIIQFDVKEHIKIMFGTLETLYGEKSPLHYRDKNFLEAVTNTFQIQTDENHKVLVKDLAKKYLEFNKTRKDFSNYYSTIFENYLVNEFFTGLYPSAVEGSIFYNYGVFLMIYKLLELTTFSMFIQNFLNQEKPLKKLDLIAMVMHYAQNIDHNKNYLKEISEYLKGKEDIKEIMKTMLQI